MSTSYIDPLENFHPVLRILAQYVDLDYFLIIGVWLLRSEECLLISNGVYESIKITDITVPVIDFLTFIILNFMKCKIIIYYV